MALDISNGTLNDNTTENSSVISLPDGLVIAANWMLIPLAICGTFLNLIAILAFFSDPKLWTPFNYYLCHLAFCDLMIACLDTVFYFINNRYGTWNLGRSVCHFWLYIDWVVTIAVAYSLMLISFDRLWAITFPVGYRIYQSRRLSLCCIVGVWLAIHTFILPGFIMERQNSVDGEGYCYQNLEGYKTWTLACQLLGYYLPHLCVIGANFSTAVRLWRKIVVAEKKKIIPAKNVISVAAPAGQAGVSALTVFQPMAPVTAVMVKKERPSLLERSTWKSSSKDGILMPPETLPAPSGKGNASDRVPLRLLISLVLCFTICWTPSYVYYSLITFLPNYQNNTFVALAQLLCFLNSVFNPLLYQFGCNDFCKAVRRLFRRFCDCFKWATVSD